MIIKEGSVYVSGTNLYFITESGVLYRYTGTSYGTVSNAIKGSIWIEDSILCYIDENNVKRCIQGYGGNSVSNAVPGSTWVNNNFIYWVTSDKKVTYGHTDNYTPGQNHGGYYYHYDTCKHGDNHYDGPGHGDDYTYSNVPHTDRYDDNTYRDTPSHKDDSYTVHTDTPHTDKVNHIDSQPHQDTGYRDSCKTGSSGTYWMPHTDIPPSHDDMPRPA